MSSPPISNRSVESALGKVHVVGDRASAGARARKSISDRVDDARPGPASGVRLEVPQRVLVDLDERDVLARGLRTRRARETPVVGLELQRLKRVDRGAVR